MGAGRGRQLVYLPLQGALRGLVLKEAGEGGLGPRSPFRSFACTQSSEQRGAGQENSRCLQQILEKPR